MKAQKTRIAARIWANTIARAPNAYNTRPVMYARLRPNRSPSLLPIRMNAADTSASSATAACTALAVVSRSRTTAEIDTFISDVSITNTNIAIASSTPRRGVPDADDEDTPRSITDETASPLNEAAPRRAVTPPSDVRHSGPLTGDSRVPAPFGLMLPLQPMRRCRRADGSGGESGAHSLRGPVRSGTVGPWPPRS